MRRYWRWILGSLIVVGLGGAWFADRQLKAHNHPGLTTFLKQWWTNYPESFSVEPAHISIAVDEDGMEQLYSVVESARDAGVIEREGNDYVDGEFQVRMPADGEGSGDFKGKLRIKGKMTDHVEGKKWSFRVVAKKSGGFLGMKRFSLQHPGTRNYLTDWFFHRLMQGEGLIALRYGFCTVDLNDESLGVYAYEEHFGPELLENNGRLPGPIVRFEPGLFWLHRTQGLEGGASVADAYGAYQAANLDAFGTDDIAVDPEQKHYYEQAVELVNAFRQGALPASKVFDVERTGKRLAMLDLVGGHHSMDWSDVKFYFDPVAQRLEPISYESFSAYPIKELAGAYKATTAFQESDELHTAFFKDPDIFAAYVRHLERFSRKEWLDSAFTVLKGPLDTASATLYGEFPYKPLDRSIYYANQKAIRKLLDTPKGFHAYDNGVQGDSMIIACVPIESMPIEVVDLVLADGRKVKPLRQALVPARMRGKTGVPVLIAFPNAGSAATRMHYRVLGSSVEKELDVFPFVLSVSSAQDDLLANRAPNPKDFSFLAVDDASRTITIKPGSWVVDRTMVLPEGYRCVASTPLKLDIVQGAEIISYAALDWRGLQDATIEVFSSDSSSHGVHVIGAKERSKLEFVYFSNLTRYKEDQERSGDVSFHASDVGMRLCFFNGTGATLLDVSVCKASLHDCRFTGGSDQLEAHFTDLSVEDCGFAAPKDDAISVEGGTARLNKNEIAGAPSGGVGVKGTRSARVIAENLTIQNMGVAFEGREGAKMDITRAVIKNVGLIGEAKKKEMRYGPVRIDLKSTTITEAKQDYKIGPESVVTMDGKKVGSNQREGNEGVR